MLEILVTAIISFIVAYLAIPVVIVIAEKKKLFDIPDERKLHKHTIASLGGVGIFLGFVFSSLIGISFQKHPEFQYIFAAAFIIFFIGLKDDIIALSAFKKLIAQIIAAAIIIHLAGIRIESFYDILGIGAVDPIYGVPFTYITIILIINAFNLIDGIDGLAGSLGVTATILFGTYFLLSGMNAYATLAFSLAAALLAFLIFNYHPAKIFMGDSGSLLVGIICSVLVLKFISVASDHDAALPIPAAVAVGVSVIIIPLIDTLRVFAIRILKGRSPFSPDRNHIHHILLDKGFNHSMITVICVSANIGIVMMAYLCSPLGSSAILAILFSAAFISMGIMYFTLPRRRMVMNRQIVSSLQAKKPASKVISLSTKEPMDIEQVQ
ncbi:MAG: MraY family glycosyltransferase [Niabella sp.]